jgi:glycerol uptake facilitator protein
MTRLHRALAREIAGTYLLVLFGTGAVAAAVLTGAQVGLWQVAVVWGFGVTLAISCTAAASGAHLNPAVTLAFALHRGSPWRRVRSRSRHCLASVVETT